jgi:hypothetical protein
MFGRLFDWVKMKRRGEHRVAPYGSRGRAFARNDGSQFDGGVAGDTHGEVTVAAKVYRSATDTWEDLGVISREKF